MVKKVRKTNELGVTTNQSETDLTHAVFEKLSIHKDGLMMALVFCRAIETSLPEWALHRLAFNQLLNHLGPSRRRLKHSDREMTIFIKNAMRYKIVRCCEGAQFLRGENKFVLAVKLLQHTWLKTGTSGLTKCYYEFQQIFGGRRLLSEYVADRVYVGMNLDEVPTKKLAHFGGFAKSSPW